MFAELLEQIGFWLTGRDSDGFPKNGDCPCCYNEGYYKCGADEDEVCGDPDCSYCH